MPSVEQTAQDAIRYWHEPVLGGIDLLTANCVNYRFARHAHEEFVLAVFERGAEEFETKGRGIIASAGSVLLIPPGVAHTGRAATAEGWSYRAFYPRMDLVREVSSDTFRSKVRLEGVSVGLYSDAQLFTQLLQAHVCLSTQKSGLDHAVELVAALGAFLTHVHPDTAIKKPGSETKAVSIAREFIDAHYCDPIDGAGIAAVVGLSLPHLMRVFFARMGVPINVYLTSVRLGHARRLLLAGERAAKVAADVGFVDQSHLIRRFRDAFGVTPGQYVRDSSARLSPWP